MGVLLSILGFGLLVYLIVWGLGKTLEGLVMDFTKLVARGRDGSMSESEKELREREK